MKMRNDVIYTADCDGYYWRSMADLDRIVADLRVYAEDDDIEYYWGYWMVKEDG